MNYLLAILCPPLSLFFSKQPIIALISVVIYIASIVLIFIGVGIILHILHVIATWFLLSKNATKAEFSKLKEELQANKEPKTETN